MKRRILFVQLPIPPAGPGRIQGNIPLSAAYMTLFARRRGLGDDFEFDILGPPRVNDAGDLAIVEEILARDPWMVGFSAYLWNVERTLWIAGRLKQRRPDLVITIGGPEITGDNAWVLGDPALDFAAIGEGEQTFAELLAELRHRPVPGRPIDGLWVSPRRGLAGGILPILGESTTPKFREPLRQLDDISSPYLEGILDAGDERLLLLETIRGCVFKCKFCYYPKSYDGLYFLSRENLLKQLDHARRRDVREVVILDPTLNQRKDFAEFLDLLAEANPDRQWSYFGELRGEGITPDLAARLARANFREVEIGLQSVGPDAQELMDRKNNLKAFERGCRAMLDAGLKVKVDLIIGLPGDTKDSIRRGIDWIRERRFFDDIQVFNLAILPGTAFRQEAAELGLRFQPRPPYFVLETPTLRLDDLFELIDHAQTAFEAEFDPMPTPRLDFAGPPGTPTIEPWRMQKSERVASSGRTGGDGARTADRRGAGGSPSDALVRHAVFDLDDPAHLAPETFAERCGPAGQRAQAFTMTLRSSRPDAWAAGARTLLDRLLDDNPFASVQLVLEPTGSVRPEELLPADLVREMPGVCLARPSYLDKLYSVLPGRPAGAKRAILSIGDCDPNTLDADWLDEVTAIAPVMYRDESGRWQEAGEVEDQVPA